MRRRALVALLGATSVTWPPVARAQPAGKTHHLAILAPVELVDRATGKRERVWTAFFDELRRRGYDEGRNLMVAWRSSVGDAKHVAELAREVAALKPDVVFTPDLFMAGALKAATTTIPVVTVTFDPVGRGLAASLSRPGGNITGFSVEAGMEVVAKRIALLKEAVPGASRMAWLVSRTLDSPAGRQARDTVQIAGVTSTVVTLERPTDEAEYRRAFAAAARERLDALVIGARLESLAHRRLLASLAAEARLPTMYAFRENVEAGGLLSYGPDLDHLFRGSADYVDRILKGADPAEMPFQQPTQFELFINLRTAKALGLTIPLSLLAGADEVIE